MYPFVSSEQIFVTIAVYAQFSETCYSLCSNLVPLNWMGTQPSLTQLLSGSRDMALLTRLSNPKVGVSGVLMSALFPTRRHSLLASPSSAAAMYDAAFMSMKLAGCMYASCPAGCSRAA